jgi:hypothetical protein
MGEETGSEELHIEPKIQTGLLKVEEKGKGRADGKDVGRKPWDPPFPKKEARGMGSIGFAVPPTAPKKTGRELEAKGVTRRLFLSDGDGEYAYDQEPNHVTIESDRAATLQPTRTTPRVTQDSAHNVVLEPASQKNKGKSKLGVVSAIWICVGILAFLLFVLAFAILIAHCLAWFLVYETEARLGEARRGIMQGGEMRLCLCAT